MAVEDITIIRVDTGEAVRSIADLKANIKAYKAALDELEIGTKDYANVLTALETNQAALRNAMHGTATSMEQIAAAANGVDDSYNGLVRRMAMMKEEIRAIDTSTAEGLKAFKNKAREINVVNSRLKDLDKLQGNYQRNVGNYASALDGLSKNFKATAGSASGLIGPIAGVTTGLKALSATPAIAILGLLANVLTKVISALKSSEENTNRMNKALAAFKPIADAATKTLQALGNVVAGLVEGIGNLLTKIGLLKEASQERIKIAEDEIELTKRQRENLMQNADAERDIAELRAKSADKEKYTSAERLQFLQEAGEKEAEIAQRAMEDAKLAYEIQKAKNALTESSAEAKQREAEAYAAMVAAETAYYEKVRGINLQMSSARKEMVSDANAAATARIAAEKAIVEQEIALARKGSAERLALQEQARKLEYEKAVSDAKKNVKDAATRNKTMLLLEKAYLNDLDKLRRDFARQRTEEELKGWENAMNGYEQGSELYLAMAVELRQRTYDTLARLDDESDATWQARRIAALKSLQQAEQELLDAQVASGRTMLENAMNALRTGSIEQMAAAADLALYELDNIHRKIGESEDAFLSRQIAARKAYEKAVEELDAAQTESGRLALENRMNALAQGSEEYLSAAIDLKKYELDTLHQMEEESDEQFRARQLAAEKAYADAQKALVMQRVSLMQTYASSLTGIMDAIADVYEQSGEEDEKAAQKAKALRTASAIVTTISGAIAAFMSTWTATELPFSVKAVLAPVNAAAVLAAGYAQIKQMNAVKVGDSAGSAAVAAPSFSPTVQQVRNVTGASEEERLNESRRVYIVYSDIEEAQRSQRVKVSETEF